MAVYRENGKSWSDKKTHTYINEHNRYIYMYIDASMCVCVPGEKKARHREIYNIHTYIETIKISIIDLATI